MYRMEHYRAQRTNWPQLVLVIIIMLLGFGIAGTNDYTIALEQDLDKAHDKINELNQELEIERSKRGIACTDIHRRYGGIALNEVQP